MNEFSVSAVTELLGISVRTLHYYDSIGLVVPAARTASGYRRYDDADIALVRRVLSYRDLGLSLVAIRSLMSDPNQTDADHLRTQARLLRERIHEDQSRLAAVDKELAARAAGIRLLSDERTDVFGSDALLDHADDAERAWGSTPEFAERRRRTSQYDKEAWTQLRTELAAINQELADAMANHIAADDSRAMDAAEHLRCHTEKWFHPCSRESHVEIAREYRDNRRSGRNYDDMVPGLSQYVHDAILANSHRRTHQ